MKGSDFILRVQALTKWDDEQTARAVGYARRTIERVRKDQMELAPRLVRNTMQALAAGGFGGEAELARIKFGEDGKPNLAARVEEPKPNVSEYRVTLRRVPVVSMARAGFLTSYDELPVDWQHSVPSDCPDPKAFGLSVEGDSMEDAYHEGDIIIVMPSFMPYPDSLVVAKLRNGDVMFKNYSVLDSKGQMIRLSSHNPRYGPRDLSIGDVEWIYPVYGAVRKSWHEDRWKLHRRQREEAFQETEEPETIYIRETGQ